MSKKLLHCKSFILRWICNTYFFPLQYGKRHCAQWKNKTKNRQEGTLFRENTCWSADSAQVKSLIIRISSNSICRNQRKGWCDSSFENIRQCHLIPLIMSFLFKYFLQPVHLEDLLFCSKLSLFHEIRSIFTVLSIVINIDNILSRSHKLGHWVNTYHPLLDLLLMTNATVRSHISHNFK